MSDTEHNSLTNTSNPTSGHSQMVAIQQTIDITSLVRENHLLSAEKELLKSKLDSLQDKYESMLENELKEKRIIQNELHLTRTSVEELRKENQKLRDENALLRKDIQNLQEQNQVLSDNQEIQHKELQTVKRELKFTRYKLLLGSVAYNFIDCAVFYTFKKDPKRRRKQLRSIDDIEEAIKDADERARWEEFKGKYWKDEFDEVLEKFTGGRLELAHPTTINDDDDECPKPSQLQEIVSEVHKRKDAARIRKYGAELVDYLDQLAQLLGRDILQ